MHAPTDCRLLGLSTAPTALVVCAGTTRVAGSRCSVSTAQWIACAGPAWRWQQQPACLATPAHARSSAPDAAACPEWPRSRQASQPCAAAGTWQHGSIQQWQRCWCWASTTACCWWLGRSCRAVATAAAAAAAAAASMAQCAPASVTGAGITAAHFFDRCRGAAVGAAPA